MASSPSFRTPRLDVVAQRGDLGQRGQDIEGGERPRRALDPVGLRENRAPQRVEDLLFPVEYAVVRPERLLLVVLQRGCDVALAVRDGLLAVVVVRDRMEIRRRHFDVVAEDPVEPDLQGGDAGSLPLGGLHRRDPAAGVAADGAQLVEIAVDAVSNRPPIARKRRRIVDQRRRDAVVDIAQIVEPVQQHADERCLKLGCVGAGRRDDADGSAERRQIARSRRTERHACDETLQVLDAGQIRPQTPPSSDLPQQFVDRVEPVQDRIPRRKGPLEPRTQQTASHRGAREIDLPEKRAGPASLGACEDLEVVESRGVDDEVIGPRPELQRPEVLELDLLRIAQVPHETARRPYCGGVLVRSQAEAVQ